MFNPKTETKQIFRAKRLDPTANMTDEIKQPDRTVPQRSYSKPYGDTRRDFPAPLGAKLTGYPSTQTTAPSLGQPIKE